MTTNQPWRRNPARMAREGKSITKISENLGVEYWEVWEYVRGTQRTKWSGWLGAKRYITKRLDQIAASNDLDDRNRLKGELADAINYLYYAGKKLGKKIDSA